MGDCSTYSGCRNIYVSAAVGPVPAMLARRRSWRISAGHRVYREQGLATETREFLLRGLGAYMHNNNGNMLCRQDHHIGAAASNAKLRLRQAEPADGRG